MNRSFQTRARWLVVSLLFIVAFSLSPHASAVTRISFGTGSTGGLYFVAGSAVASVVNQFQDSIEVDPQSTTGSTPATILVNSHDLDLGQASADSAYHGFHGTREFRGQRQEDVRVVMAIMDVGLGFIVRADSDIRSLADLRGKRVGANSGADELRIRAVLKRYGLDEGDYNLRLLSYGEQATALRDRALDVAFLTSFPENSTVMELATTVGIRFLTIGETESEDFAREFPYWTPLELPAGFYAGQDAEVKLVALRGLLLANKNVPDDIIYTLLEVVTSNTDKIAAIHPVGSQFSLEQTRTYIENDLILVPWHPAAERFFKDRGVLE